MSAVMIDGPIVEEINRHHDAARRAATEAVGHARAAGELLLQVKSQLPHGQWLPWLAASVNVSARQAQRYIAVAQGKPQPIRKLAGKCETVSHLGSDGAVLKRMQDAPGFTPEAGMVHAAIVRLQDGSEAMFVVEPSSADVGFWFVSRMPLAEGDDFVNCTARPIRSDFVGTMLAYYGMAGDPEWRVKPSAGVRFAFETFCTPEEIEEELARLARKESIPEAIERMKRSNERTAA